MENGTFPRRAMLAAGALALPLAAAAQNPSTTAAGLNLGAEQTIRRWYRAWEQNDWQPLDALLTSDFTFSSAAGDDHISKSDFKAQCWQTQIGFIDRFELEKVFGSGNEALVLYTGHTKSGATFCNVEHVRLRDDQIESIQCYFGEESSFPSAVSKSTASEPARGSD